jgi:hypothetical protein
MPTVTYVNKNKTNPLYVTTRRQNGVDFAIFIKSGYDDPKAAIRQNTTHYTLDALTGDVIAAVNVEDAAATNNLTRTASPTRTRSSPTRSASTGARSRASRRSSSTSTHTPKAS